MQTSNDTSLDRIQRWMQAVITHPDGPAAGLDSPPAQAAIEVASDRLEQVVCRSQNLTSLERLQIYSNAYLARLVECMRAEYPALLHLLGADTFDSFAVAYLQSYPSTSYTLAHLSEHFPRFLEETRPDDGSADEPAAPDAADVGWIEFVIDLATVERTYSEVFDGPGLEGDAPLTPSDLAAVRSDDWHRIRLLMNPSVRLLSLRFPAHEYVSSVRQDGEACIPAPQATYLVVFRREFTVRRTPVAVREYAILTALDAGEPLGTAIERGIALNHPEPIPAAETLREWYRSWTAATWFRGIALPQSE